MDQSEGEMEEDETEWMNSLMDSDSFSSTTASGKLRCSHGKFQQLPLIHSSTI